MAILLNLVKYIYQLDILPANEDTSLLSQVIVSPEWCEQSEPLASGSLLLSPVEKSVEGTWFTACVLSSQYYIAIAVDLLTRQCHILS